jgi:hypothetical protein
LFFENDNITKLPTTPRLPYHHETYPTIWTHRCRCFIGTLPLSQGRQQQQQQRCLFKNALYDIMCDDGALHYAHEDSDILIQKLADEALIICNKDGIPLTPFPKPPSPAEVRAAEMRDAALFKEAPPEDDCPLCGLRYPMKSETLYSKCLFP